jgi:hypothetical protein
MRKNGRVDHASPQNSKSGLGYVLAKGIKSLLLLASFSSLFLSGCQQVGNSTLPRKENPSSIQKSKDISDSPANREHFEKQRAIWESKKPNHYQVDFIFSCDCTYRTSQLREVIVNGKTTTERSGETITVEVKNGVVVDVRKTRGEHALVGEYRRADKASSSLPEYLWNVGKDDKDGQRLISDPIAYLWKRASEGFQKQSPPIFNITYDGNWGFIKFIEFSSGIPDNYFKAEIKNFIVL